MSRPRNTRRRMAGPLQSPTPTPPVALRIATYRRASTDEANQPFSLEAQQSSVGAYIASQEGWTLVADYEERASAKDIAGRPQLQKLLRDARDGHFDVVLVHKIDRWSRRLSDLLSTTELLLEVDVGFRSATEQFDSTSPTGRFVLQPPGLLR